MQQTLYLMLGYPGSGKSHFAVQLAPQINAVRLSTHSIRINMFDNPRDHMNPEDNEKISNVQNYVTDAVLSARQSVIYGALMESYADRKRVYKLAKKLGVRHALIWLQTPAQTAMRQSGPNELINEYSEAKLEKPKLNEHTIVIAGDSEFEEQLSTLIQQASNGA